MNCVIFVTGCFFLLSWTVTEVTALEDKKVLVEPLETHLIVQKNGRLILDCPVTSYSTRPQYYWTKDGESLESQDRYHIAANGSLIFERIINKRRKGRNDAGLYECYVENQYGTVLGRRVTVDIAKQSLSIIPSAPHVTVGGVARLECKMNLSSKKLPFYVWKKGNGQFDTDTERIVSNLGVLQIYNVTSEDAGNYVCQVFPTSDHVDILEKRVQLTVDPGNLPSQISILSTPTNMTVKAGNPFVFECIVEGQSPPTVIWQDKDGLEVTNIRERYTLFGNKNLRIQSVHVEDAGAYVCVVTTPGSRKQSIRKTYILNVIAPPEIVKEPVSVRHPLAQMTRMTCHAKGTPQPQIHWYRNGIRAVPAHFKFLDDEVVLPGNIRDTGYYQCVAENEAGIDVATAWAEFERKPGTPDVPQNVTARAISATEVMVNWTASGVTGKGTAYSIIYHKVSKMDFEKKPTDKTGYVITGLEPYTDYSFAVRQFNKSGGGHLSEAIIVKTLEAPPTAVPNVQIAEDTISSFRVTWGDIPEADRHGEITRHKLYYGTEEKTTVLQNLAADARSHLVTGLEPDTKYRIKVLSGNSAGYPTIPEDKVPWVSYRTPRGNQEVLPTPVLKFKPINNSAVLMSWNGQQYPEVSSYRVTVQKLLESGPVREYNISSTTFQLLITNLENNTFYSIDLIVKSREQTSIGVVTDAYHSIDVGLPRQPPPPMLLDPRSPSSSVISLKWNRPKTDMNITHYTVQYNRRDDDFLLYVKHIESYDLATNIEDLSSFTWYVIAVKAHTLTTSSPYSKPVLVQTKEGIPSPPERVTAEVVSPGTVKLRWGPPKKQNGIITFYIIYYNIDKDMPDQEWNSLKQNGSMTSVLVNDLTQKVYYFKLKACTNAGEGKPSTIVAIEAQGCPQETCPQCPATFVCPYEVPEDGNTGTSVFEQRLGIIIGSVVGLVSIIFCAIFVIVRHRQYRRMYSAHETAAVSASSHNSIGRYLSDPLRGENSSDSSSSPILGRLKENENSDSKGGVFSSGGNFCNGMKAALFHNGQPVTIISAEQRALLSPSSSSQGNEDSVVEGQQLELGRSGAHFSPKRGSVDSKNVYSNLVCDGQGQNYQKSQGNLDDSHPDNPENGDLVIVPDSRNSCGTDDIETDSHSDVDRTSCDKFKCTSNDAISSSSDTLPCGQCANPDSNSKSFTKTGNIASKYVKSAATEPHNTLFAGCPSTSAQLTDRDNFSEEV